MTHVYDRVTVVDVGAGAGSSERRDRGVVAVEPSPLMLARLIVAEY